MKEKIKVKNTTSLAGQVIAPSSKSQTIRSIFFASLAHGESILLNVLNSTDTQDAIRICRQLGANIGEYADALLVQGINKQPNRGIACQDTLFFSGNSGLTTRFVLPLLGLRANPEQAVTLDCGEQMRARPIVSLVDALIQLGLTIQYLNQPGFCPVSISGSLQGGVAEIQGISSQDVSALLLTLPCAEKDSEIRVKNCPSRPYFEMTLDGLKQQKIMYTHKREGNSDIFTIRGRQHYQKFQRMITGDFSSASYIIAAAALIPGCVQVCGLNREDAQGDKKLIAILQAMGADIVLEPTRITIRGGKVLTGIKVDASSIPDLLPTLAVIGTYATGKTEISHVKQARIKETDRIHSMTLGLRQLGACIEEYEDGMTVYSSKLVGAAVKGFGDHRSVMALALAGMLATGTTEIDGSEAVNKTFPEFIKVMQFIGANVQYCHPAFIPGSGFVLPDPAIPATSAGPG